MSLSLPYGFWLSRSCFQSAIPVRALMEEPVMKKAEETTAVNVEVAGLENDVKLYLVGNSLK